MANDKGFWKGFKDGLQNDDSSNVQQGMSVNPSHLVKEYGWQITTKETLIYS